MNLELATRIRAAINDTTHCLRSEPPEATRTALQTHLDALLKEELRALTGQALDGESHVKLNLTLDTTDLRAELARLQAQLAALKAEKHTTPWYPDDSGEWVEVPDDCMTCPVAARAKVEVLTFYERADKRWTRALDAADAWIWDHSPRYGARIVAYKVVKP